MATITPVVVPYSGPVPGGVHQGLEIEVQGTVPHYAQQGFSVNLCQGPQREPNTTLHFNPRFNEGCIVLNHMQNNGWGSEERKHGVHIHKGRPFDLRIMVKPQMFKIRLNGQHVADFGHRLPKEMAQFFVVDGEVSINYIKFNDGRGHGCHGGRGGGYAPPPYAQPGYNPPYGPSNPCWGGGIPAGSTPFAPPPSSYPMAGGHSHGHASCHGEGSSLGREASHFLHNTLTSMFKGLNTFVKQGAAPPPQPSMGGQPIFNPPVPFNSGIPGGLSPGRMIHISGIPHHNPSRFSINLQNGPYESGDIAMTFDIRFRFGDSINTVVRNHRQGGQWGQEERGVTFFPFMPNSNFDMIILAEPQAFKVAVNNQHLVEFFHRLPIHTANTLNITGDVRLTQVRFQ